MTKLTIITINRNNAAGLRRTIESVLSQSYTDFETPLGAWGRDMQN